MEVIKFAKPEDVPQIVALGYKSFNENELSGIGADPHFEKVVIEITDVVTEHAALVLRNPENDAHIDGTLVMKINTPWWSADPVLYCMLFFIKQEARTFANAKALLDAAKEYAIINNVPIALDLFAQKDVEKKRKLLKYMGFKELGTLFVYHPARETKKE